MADITGAPAQNNRPEPRRPSRGWWLILIAVIAVGSLALYWKTRPVEPQKGAAAQVAAVRTVSAASGSVVQTIRLTGTTAAKNYASLLAPQVRGRGGMRQVSTGQMVQASAGRGGGGGGGGDDHSHSDSGGSSSDSSSSTASTAAASASVAGSSSIGVSGTSGAIGASSNLVSSVTRFSPASKSASSSKNSISTSASTSSAMGSSGLGSTGGSLQGGGGGGMGGGGDFQLVIEKLIDGGARVRKGDVVAEFDRQYMLQRLDDFKANHAQNEDALKALASNLAVQKKAHQQLIDAARADLDKAQLDLKTTPVRSKIVAEQLKLAVEEAQANYKLLLSEVKFKDVSFNSQLRRAQLDSDQEALELQRAQNNADKMLVKAPMDGIAVISTIFRSGQFGQIQAGDQVFPGMTFMQIVDQSSMVVNASISQTDIEKIRVGAKATVHFDAYPDLVLPATLYSIGALSKPIGFRPNYVSNVPVTLKLDRVDPRVIPDLTVSAEVVISKEDTGTVVPLAGVLSDPSTNRPVALVRTASGWEKRDIQLGLRNNVHAIVRSGLRPGEVVAAEWPAVAEKPGEKKKG